MRWLQTGRTFTLSLGGFHLLEVIIRRSNQYHVETSKWEIAVRGIHETGPANPDGSSITFEPREPMEMEPGPEVFAAAREYAEEVIGMILIDLRCTGRHE